MILCMECACTSLLHIESIQVLVIVTVYWVPIIYKELYRFVSYRAVFYYNLAGEIGHVYYSQSDRLKNSLVVSCDTKIFKFLSGHWWSACTHLCNATLHHFLLCSLTPSYVGFFHFLDCKLHEGRSFLLLCLVLEL